MGQADGARGALSPSRAGRQARSVEAALAGRGLGFDATRGAIAALAAAMEPRADLDDHHPSYLHPGRSALVLLHDVEDLPADAVRLAILHESQDRALQPPADRIEQVAGSEAVAALAAMPLPGDDALTERLVLLPRPDGLAILAERLDHLRHLHLRTDLENGWADTHEEVRRVWLPFAQRLEPRLARRIGHWDRTFAKRLRRRERAG